MKIVAMIPARAGSKGIPNKNGKIMAGKPMLQWTIEAALQSKRINTVEVNTDSDEYFDLARGMGVFCYWRDKALAEDHTTMLAVVYDYILGRDFDNDTAVVVLYPTYPLRTGQDIDDIIDYYLLDTSRPLLGLKPVKSHPYLAMAEIDGDIRPVVKHSLYRRQDYPKCWEITHFACVVPVQLCNRKKQKLNLQLMHKGGEMQRYMRLEKYKDSLLDVDTVLDFYQAEKLLEERLCQKQLQ